MSAIKRTRSECERTSPQTFVARVIVAIFLFAIFLAVFVLPWLFTGGR